MSLPHPVSNEMTTISLREAQVFLDTEAARDTPEGIPYRDIEDVLIYKDVSSSLKAVLMSCLGEEHSG